MDPTKNVRRFPDLPSNYFASKNIFSDDLTPTIAANGLDRRHRNSSNASDFLTINSSRSKYDLSKNPLDSDQKINGSRCGSQCSLFSDGGESLTSFDSFSNESSNQQQQQQRPVSAEASPGNYRGGDNRSGNKRRSISDVRQSNKKEQIDNGDNTIPYRSRAFTVCVGSNCTNRRSSSRGGCNGINSSRRAVSNVRTTTSTTSTSKLLPENNSDASIQQLNRLNPRENYSSTFDFNQQSVKRVHTEQVMSKHTLKGKLSKFQRLIDKAIQLVKTAVDDGDGDHDHDEEGNIVEGAHMMAKIMINAWMSPKIGRDLAYGLCDYLR